MSNQKWQTELPQEEGDYLWLNRFSCGCIGIHGIAWVEVYDESWFTKIPTEGLEEDGWFSYKLPNNKWAILSGEHLEKLVIDKLPEPDLWLKLDMPPSEDQLMRMKDDNS